MNFIFIFAGKTTIICLCHVTLHKLEYGKQNHCFVFIRTVTVCKVNFYVMAIVEISQDKQNHMSNYWKSSVFHSKHLNIGLQ